MSTDEYVPHESYVREAWVDRLGTDNPLFMDEAEDEFDRFLARVRRDAWNEGWTAELDDNNPYEETP